MTKTAILLGSILILSGCVVKIDPSNPVHKHAIERCKNLGGSKLSLHQEGLNEPFFYCYDINEQLIEQWSSFKYRKQATATVIER